MWVSIAVASSRGVGRIHGLIFVGRRLFRERFEVQRGTAKDAVEGLRYGAIKLRFRQLLRWGTLLDPLLDERRLTFADPEHCPAESISAGSDQGLVGGRERFYAQGQRRGGDAGAYAGFTSDLFTCGVGMYGSLDVCDRYETQPCWNAPLYLRHPRPCGS